MSHSFTRQKIQSFLHSRLDVPVFGGAFVFGLIGYFLLRGFGQVAQTSAVLAAMLAYALTVFVVPRLRVRLDQAGDNAYYLGLLFTLSSMAVALWDFAQMSGRVVGDGPSAADHIISNFGIALASTIVGIFLRVIMHQMRVDPADVERVSRLELTEASSKVKSILDTVSRDMALFHGQISQRMNDVVTVATQEVTKVLSGFAEEVSHSTSKILVRTDEAQNEVVEHSRRVVEKLDATVAGAEAAIMRLAQVEPPPTKLATRLDKVSASLEELEKPIEELKQQFSGAALAQTEAVERLAGAADKLIQFSRANAEQQQAVIGELHQAAVTFKDTLKSTAGAMDQHKELLSEIHETGKATAEQSRKIQDGNIEVMRRLAEIMKELASSIRHENGAGGSEHGLISVERANAK
jgi:Mg2+ and Co2+ transporter CorA